MLETQIQSLGWENPLEEEMVLHSSILVWKTPWTEESSGLQSMGSQRVRHDWPSEHRNMNLSSVQSLSHVWFFVIPITSSQSLLKLMSIKLLMPSNIFILCHPFLLLSSIFPSIRVFSNESVLRIRWPKYWSFSFSISPSNEHPRLTSFRMDWLDLLTVQGTLRSLL